MDLTKKIAAAAGALTLGVAGVAAAATTPDAADAGLTKASDNVGIELPASHDSHPGAEAGEGPELTDDTTTGDTTPEVEAGGPEDNHGAVVSAVAQSEFETGREHGEAVSAAARDNHGAEMSDSSSGEVDDDEVEDHADAAGAHARK